MTRDDFIELTQDLPEGYFLVASSGTIVAANPAAVRLFGGSLEGKALADLTGDPRKKVEGYLRACLRSDKSVTARMRWRVAGAECEHRCHGRRLRASTREGPLLLLRCDHTHTPSKRFKALSRALDRLKAQKVALEREVTQRKRAEEEVWQARKDWERTFDAITDPIWLLDTSFSIVRANKAASEKLGVPPSETVGRKCYEIVHCLGEPIEGCPHQRLLGDGKCHSQAVFEPRLGGHYHVTVSPTHDPDGTLTGSVHLARDIADLKRAEERLRRNERRLRDITSCLGDGLYVTDAEGLVTFANPECERMLGWTEAELLGQRVHDLVHSRSPAGREVALADCALHSVCRTGRSYTSNEEVFTARDGRVFPVSAICAPLLDEGKLVGAVTSFRDISRTKQLELDRESLIVDLQKAVAEIRTLQGILPICSFCKKIRNDRGTWQRLESYLSEHTEALLSHGICQECLSQHFSEFFDPQAEDRSEFGQRHYDRYLATLLSGERSVCRTLVQRLLEGGVSPLDIYVDVFRRSLYDIGELWEIGRVSVAVEHMATALTQELLGVVYPYVAPQPRQDKRAVVSCSPGEQHQMGARMVTDVLEWSGWSTFFLGESPSVADLVAVAREKKPDLLALSASLHTSVAGTTAAIEALRQGCPGLPILVGGRALGENKTAFVDTPGVTRVETLPQLKELLSQGQIPRPL